MKLVSFRIQSYCSIIDTEWCWLSSDNITGLIGQNESGKSSVLEALYAFYTGEIEDDNIRSSGDYPKISCRFELSAEEFDKIFDGVETPEGFRDLLEASDWQFNLNRSWNGLDQANSVMDLDEDLSAVLITNQDIKEQDAVEDDPEGEESEEVEAEPEAESKPSEEVIELELSECTAKLIEELPEFVRFANNASSLPAMIDYADIEASNDVDGIMGAQNFLRLTGLTKEEILNPSQRRAGVKIRLANKKITADFHKFWMQFIGDKKTKIGIEFEVKNYDNTVGEKVGEPYLIFWVKHGDELLHPNQRSKGVQWFLSFYLQLMSSALADSKPQILLIDEPGESLHAKAQRDILKVFEETKQRIQIIYTTHSPYLLEADRTYRLRAVQRDGGEENGETNILSASDLGAASTDTLFPLFSVIGADLASQNVIQKHNNVILEEPSAYYYFMAFLKLTGESHEMHFLPSTGVANVNMYVNLFMGWGLDFLVCVDDDKEARTQMKLLADNVYGGVNDESKKHLMRIKGCAGVEDIFSKTDFRKYMLENTRLRYSESNSQYMKINSIAKVLPAVKFHKKVEDGDFSLSDLSQNTQKKIKEVIETIVARLDEITT